MIFELFNCTYLHDRLRLPTRYLQPDIYILPCFDISQNNGMEYVSLKFPNFADTARIHYAATDFANGTGQVWCAGG